MANNFAALAKTIGYVRLQRCRPKLTVASLLIRCNGRSVNRCYFKMVKSPAVTKEESFAPTPLQVVDPSGYPGILHPGRYHANDSKKAINMNTSQKNPCCLMARKASASLVRLSRFERSSLIWSRLPPIELPEADRVPKPFPSSHDAYCSCSFFPAMAFASNPSNCAVP
jgi:hypothetical protein